MGLLMCSSHCPEKDASADEENATRSPARSQCGISRMTAWALITMPPSLLPPGRWSRADRNRLAGGARFIGRSVDHPVGRRNEDQGRPAFPGVRLPRRTSPTFYRTSPRTVVLSVPCLRKAEAGGEGGARGRIRWLWGLERRGYRAILAAAAPISPNAGLEKPEAPARNALPIPSASPKGRCPSGKAAKRPGQGRRKPPAIKYLHFQLTFHAQIGYGAAHAHAPEGPTPADFRRRSRLHPPVDRRSSGVESQDRVEAGV
jgi:hypothetical protein